MCHYVSTTLYYKTSYKHFITQITLHMCTFVIDPLAPTNKSSTAVNGIRDILCLESDMGNQSSTNCNFKAITSNDIIAGNGRTLIAYMFLVWLNLGVRMKSQILAEDV